MPAVGVVDGGGVGEEPVVGVDEGGEAEELGCMSGCRGAGVLMGVLTWSVGEKPWKEGDSSH